jgi:hypothetical protein
LKSSVSRRFVALTRAQLTTWLAQRLDGLDVRIILIDGLHFRDHAAAVALDCRVPRFAACTPRGGGGGPDGLERGGTGAAPAALDGTPSRPPIAPSTERPRRSDALVAKVRVRSDRFVLPETVVEPTKHRLPHVDVFVRDGHCRDRGHSGIGSVGRPASIAPNRFPTAF